MVRLKLSSRGNSLALRLAAALLVAALLGMGCAKSEPAAEPTATTAAPVAATPTPGVLPTPTPATSGPMATPTPSVAAEKPVYGGILKRAHPNDPAGFDPVHDTSITTTYLIAPIYSQLVRYSPTEGVSVIEPELAENWKFSDDGLALTFNLRKGVTWSDGKPFTSADVVYWFDRFQNPPKGITSTRSTPFTHIKALEAPDPYTVVFRMEFTRASTLSAFAGGHLMVHSKHVVEEATKSDVAALRKRPQLAIGTGPFVFDRYEPGIIFTVRKNSAYWDPTRPYLDGVDFYIIQDSTTRFTALATGSLHMSAHGSLSLQEAQARQAKERFSDKIILEPHLGPYWIGVKFNASKSPYNDPRVRKAMKMVVDLDQYMEVVTGGTELGVGKISGYMPIETFWSLPTSEIFAIPGYRRGQGKVEDIAAAKRLMADAGYPNGFSQTFIVRDDVLRINSAVFVADQWQKHLNIRTTNQVMTQAAMDGLILEGRFDVTSGGVAANFPDPDTFILNYWSQYPGLGVGSATDPELDRLLEQQQTVLDPLKRRELVWAAERLIQNELVPDFIGHWSRYVYGTSPKVGGWKALDFMVYNQYRMDFVWLRK